LFNFDVHEDVRLGPIDSRVEKDGKAKASAWLGDVLSVARSQKTQFFVAFPQSPIQGK